MHAAGEPMKCTHRLHTNPHSEVRCEQEVSNAKIDKSNVPRTWTGCISMPRDQIQEGKGRATTHCATVVCTQRRAGCVVDASQHFLHTPTFDRHLTVLGAQNTPKRLLS